MMTISTVKGSHSDCYQSSSILPELRLTCQAALRDHLTQTPCSEYIIEDSVTLYFQDVDLNEQNKEQTYFYSVSICFLFAVISSHTGFCFLNM